MAVQASVGEEYYFMTPEQGGGTKVLINILGGDNERLEEKKITKPLVVLWKISLENK